MEKRIAQFKINLVRCLARDQGKQKRCIFMRSLDAAFVRFRLTVRDSFSFSIQAKMRRRYG